MCKHQPLIDGSVNPFSESSLRMQLRDAANSLQIITTVIDAEAGPLPGRLRGAAATFHVAAEADGAARHLEMELLTVADIAPGAEGQASDSQPTA
jgi:hypothetical protein